MRWIRYPSSLEVPPAATAALARPASRRPAAAASSASSQVAGRQDPAAADHRRGDPILRGHHLEAEAALVAEPAVVDVVVVAGEHPGHALVADGELHVALARAEGADGARVLDVPGAGAEPVGLRRQRAHRAQLDDVAVEGGDVGAVVEGADIGRRPALEELELLVLGDLLAEAHAAVAEDAALAVDPHQRRQRHRLLEVALGVDDAASARAPAHRDVLERALTALVADRAVERVVDEQELDDRVLGLLHAVGLRVDDHAVAYRRRAGGLELRDALDLDEAHAAGTDRLAQLRLVAEHGDLDVAVLGGVDQHRAVGSRDLDPVHDQGHIGPLCGHAGTATGPAMRARSIDLLELAAELRDHRSRPASPSSRRARRGSCR